MTHRQRPATRVSPSSSVSYPPSSSCTNKALRRQIEADLAQITRCQRGDHTMLATQSPGVVFCTFCRMIGVCLWCGVIPPQGACIVPCAAHAHLATIEAAARGGAAMETHLIPTTNGKE